MMKTYKYVICVSAVILIHLVFFSIIPAESAQKIRESVIAGSWYPDDPNKLSAAIKGYLEKVPEQEIGGKITALIAPHAGYMYSGPVAAHAYKLLEKQKFETVVIIAPSHRARFSGVSVYDADGYRTPLGLVPLDDDLIGVLKKNNKQIRYVPKAHAQEHSLEIHLPFLQTVMPGFKLVPLVMGDQSMDTCRVLADILVSAVKNKSALIIASTDLSHYHPREQAQKMDQIFIDHVKTLDAEGLDQAIGSRSCEACGAGPVLAAMMAAQRLGADHTEILHYANSGDVTKDYKQVVGYLAAAFLKSGMKSKTDTAHDLTQTDSIKTGLMETGLTEADKQLLHQIARTAIEARLKNQTPPDHAITSPVLKETRGAFVTLKKNGHLRGCIGNLIGRYPLHETITNMAAAAAFNDPRFRPLTASEWKNTDIEISVLTPMKKITDVSIIEVGTHGIYMKKGFRSGVLLPQVAVEYNWDRQTFLEQTCQKAGLPKDAWKDHETEIYIFSAEIF